MAIKKARHDMQNIAMNPQPQTLKFSNGFAVTHSAASKALVKFVKNVEHGTLDIGITARFLAPGIEIVGLSKNSKSTLSILKG